jgi:hypothetical protein
MCPSYPAAPKLSCRKGGNHMASNRDLRRLRKGFLSQLYNVKAGRGTIDDIIANLQVSMDQEDVEWVKQVFEKFVEGRRVAD